MTTEASESRGSRRGALRVLVTGGTGFVGFHSVRALVEAGHEVVLLVRSVRKMERVYGAVGLTDLPTVAGDITDAAAVAAAMEGCNAVLHAAAAVSVRARDAERVTHTNLRGTELVLGGAIERGIERAVQVSSATALLREGATRIDETSPLGTATGGYGGSKVACDHYVRTLQERGAPIQTLYPGSVIGPEDPGTSEAMTGLLTFLDTRIIPELPTGIQFVDVRDLARVHVALLERGGPPDRFVLGGHYATWRELRALLAEITGERFLGPPAPAALARVAGALADLAGLLLAIETPLSQEAVRYATRWVECDDRYVKQTLGLELRPLRESLRDAVAWLGATGRAQRGAWHRLLSECAKP